MKKYNILIKSIFAMAIATVLYACYPGGSIPIADLDTVTTAYIAEDFDPKPTTVALSSNVVYLKSSDPDNDLPYNGEVDDEILGTTKTELERIYGASNVFIIDDVTDTTIIKQVDLVVVPNIALRKTLVGVVIPGYPGWGWGPGWGGWYPGWGGCYYCGGYWPPYISYQQYEGGSVILDMYNMDKLRKYLDDNGGQVPDNPEESFDPSWVGVATGLISSNEQFNADRVVDGIQKAFDQDHSPVLY